jgi:uncharacterized RDD family membrane protein YckC
MTTTMDDYIKQVLEQMPAGTPLRSQIALELKGMIGERLARGQSMDEVLRQLGDPASFAESYLSAEPLEAAPHDTRIVAKLIDWVALVLAMAVILAVSMMVADEGRRVWYRYFYMYFPFAVLGGSLLLSIYTFVAEYWSSATVGKRLMGLRVVRESGARIGLGQAFVRQLAAVLQVSFFDALFVLFTDKRQRACELLSKTRVVRAKRAGAQ